MTTRAYDKLIAANSIIGSITTDQLESIEEAQACMEALRAIKKAIKIEQESKEQ